MGQDGRIWVGDAAYDSLSRALRAIHPNGRGGNGWWYWGIEGTDRRMYEIRDEYLASIGVDADVDDDEELDA